MLKRETPELRPKGFERWEITLCLLLIIAVTLLLGTGCGSLVPVNKTTSTAQAAQDKFNTTSSEKLRSVVNGRLAPVPVIAPANRPSTTTLTVSGKDNVVAVMQPEPEAESGLGSGVLGLGPRRQTPSARPQTYREPQPREEIEWESNAGQSSESEDSSSMFSKVKIPLGVSLILLAIGLSMLGGVIYFGVKYVKSTGAGAAALNLADNGMAKMIAAAEAKLNAASDPKEQALTAMHLAELNKARGQNARNMKPPKVI